MFNHPRVAAYAETLVEKAETSTLSQEQVEFLGAYALHQALEYALSGGDLDALLAKAEAARNTRE